MTYVATAKVIKVLGHNFQSFLTESEEVFIDFHQVAISFDVPVYVISEALKTQPITLLTNVCSNPILVISLFELVQVVSLLAQKGNGKAKQLMLGSFQAVGMYL